MLYRVSTHSRPEAAGLAGRFGSQYVTVSTHSRPEAAGQLLGSIPTQGTVSTHSRPEAAGSALNAPLVLCWFQLTAARRRLDLQARVYGLFDQFQLTAARRRLASSPSVFNPDR